MRNAVFLRAVRSWPVLYLSLSLLAAAAHAVPIAFAKPQFFISPITGELLTPGSNLTTDPSLGGQIVAQADRPFSLEVTKVRLFPPDLPPVTYTLHGTLHDWVVRRSDTGTLDFYAYLEMEQFASFAGSCRVRALPTA
jgi:hypothetical protein